MRTVHRQREGVRRPRHEVLRQSGIFRIKVVLPESVETRTARKYVVNMVRNRVPFEFVRRPRIAVQKGITHTSPKWGDVEFMQRELHRVRSSWAGLRDTDVVFAHEPGLVRLVGVRSARGALRHLRDSSGATEGRRRRCRFCPAVPRHPRATHGRS